MAISLSALEILPAALDKSKTQTIRPPCKCKHHPDGIHYPVGSRHTVYWKQRTSPKEATFCSVCGNEANDVIGGGYLGVGMAPHLGCITGNEPETVFPKVLGTAKITKVYKIEMDWHYLLGAKEYTVNLNGTLLGVNKLIRLAKRDGFKDDYGLIDYFDSNYDLSSPKPFWVIEYEWQK